MSDEIKRIYMLMLSTKFGMQMLGDDGKTYDYGLTYCRQSIEELVSSHVA